MNEDIAEALEQLIEKSLETDLRHTYFPIVTRDLVKKVRVTVLPTRVRNRLWRGIARGSAYMDKRPRAN